MKTTIAIEDSVEIDATGLTAGQIATINLAALFPNIFNRTRNDFSMILYIDNLTEGVVAIQGSASDTHKPSARKIATTEQDKISGLGPSQTNLYLYVESNTNTIVLSIDVVETEI